MRIYLFRHATAELRRENLSDRERRLTPEGHKELQAAAKALTKLKVAPDSILASPYRRAWDTALAVGQMLRPPGKPAELAALAPGSNPVRLWTELRKHHAARSVMLVGHEPLLTEFAAFLLGSPSLTIHLKKCGMIRVDVHTVQIDRPAGTLRWVLTPKQLARMA
jgi:phosphohistidine phosphatase